MADGERAPRNGTSDDGESKAVPAAVFEVHGKRLEYSKSSLYVFGEGSRVRLACVQTVAHPWFDRLVLLLIILNSIVLALVDWSVVDEDPSSEDVGEPLAEGSWRNTLLYETEIIFTILFALEFVLKVIAQGFILGRGAYLRDSWNIIDFLVVVTSLLASIPGMPSTSAVRVFRVLRPLRSISALPGLQHLVVSLLRSVPQLVSVVILLQFIFIVFGTFAIQIFAGKQHSRCRLTPYPVTTAFEIGMDYADHRCLEASNFDTVDEESSWTQSTSPWSTPRECYWPLDTEDTRLCAFESSSGNHKCEHDPLYVNVSDFRWCGSDYDALGNRRFAGGVIGGVEWGAADLAANATFVEDLAWGYTTFDNVFKAFLTIFQSITLEGWSDVLYQVKDCSLPIVADLFFIILVLWGAFFTLNLLLAVLEANFSQGKDGEDGQLAEVAMMAADEELVQVHVHDDDDAAATGAAAEERATAAEQKIEDSTADVGWRVGQSSVGGGKREGVDGKGVDKGEARITETSLSSKSSRNSSSGSEGEYPEWRLALRRLVSSEKFMRTVTIFIALNTLVLALDHHPMDDEFSTGLEACNLAFTLCFALEMVTKLAALGPRGYAEDKLNLFDALIVVSSLVELALSPPDILTGGADGDVGSGLSALRSFRVFRVFKLAREWSSMRDLLETLRKTLLDIGNFTLLLLLFMFVYILVGVQFFANHFHFDEDGKVIGIGEEGYYDAEVPRSNFDTLFHAFITVFEVLSGENWNATMYSARRAVGWVSVFYFVSLIVFGMMIVMSLFLAILLSHFSTSEEDNIGTKEGEERQRQLAQQHYRGNNDAIGAKHAQKQDNTRERGGVKTGEAAHRGRGDGGNINNTSQLEEIVGGLEPCSEDDLDDAEGNPDTTPGRAKSQANRAASAAPWSSVEDGKVDEDDHSDTGRERASHAQRRQQQQQQQTSNSNSVDTSTEDEGSAGFALCCLSAENPLRKGCVAIVSNAWFDRFITLLILFSSVDLVIDNPLVDPDSTMGKALEIVEAVTTVLFTIEFLLKVFACGFYFMPQAYLRDTWNILDFVVVVASISHLVIASGPLRALRALRPLRLIKRLPGLKLVLEVLLASIPGVLSVAAVCFMFYIIFAILSVNYFKGVLMSCQGDDFDALPTSAATFLENPSPWSQMTAEQREWFGPLSNVSEVAFSLSEDECVAVSGGLWPESAGCCSSWPSSALEAPTSFEVCECLGLEWGETIPQQFNNIALALLTLFEISTTEGWTSVTYAAVDSTSEDMQPIRDHALWRAWFFLLFMLVGAYLVLNLFVGVVVDNFKTMKADMEGSLFVTDNQRAWTKTQMIMRRLRPTFRPQSPADPVGAWCFRLVHRKWFDPTVMVLIALNTVVMAMEYFGQSSTYTTVLEALNYSFFILFALEALVKITALRWAYFKDLWNRFDLFVIGGSAAGLLAVWLVGSSYGSIATIIRIFRVGRVLRLVRGLESMAQLFSTLLTTLPSLANVGCLLFLLFFIYAAMGVQLYAKVSLEGAVTSQANFRSFWDTMVLLLRFSTGENWNGFMYDMAADREGCVSDPEYDPDVCGFTSHANCIPLNGCGSWSIFPYMISFTFTITFVFLNLFIGVILDGFDTAKEESDGFITQEDFSRFADHWADFDPHAICLISVPDLHAFLQTLFKPWGFGVEYQASGRELRHKIRRLNLHVFDGNRVHFKDVLRALSEEVYRTEAAKMGESADLQESYKAEEGKTIGGWGTKKRGTGYMTNPVTNTTITFDQILAVEFLQQAFRRKVAQRQKERKAEAEVPAVPAATTMGVGAAAAVAAASNNTYKVVFAAPPFTAIEDGVEDEEAKATEDGVEDEGAKEGKATAIGFAGGSAPGSE